MALKAVFKSPRELVDHVLDECTSIKIGAIKIKCFGSNAFGFKSSIEDEVHICKLGNDIFIIIDLLHTFLIEYIENIDFVEKETGVEHYYSVDSHYFRKYIKDNVIQRLDGMNEKH